VVKPQGGKPSMRAFYLTIVAIAVVGIAALSYLASRPRRQVGEWDSSLPKLTAQGHVIGSDSAKLEVIEFADMECPACGSWATVTEPDVRARLINTGIIRLRYMDFPLPVHKNTWNAHRAAWCAGDQGKFWEMHDAIYANQDKWNGETTDNPDKVLAGIAQGVGLNMDQYAKCVADRKFQAQIQSNYDEAVRRNVNQTPTFVFGSQVVPGELPYDEFKKYVDAAIAAQESAKKAK
jgi:protein-disulfide isomerase